MAIPIFSLLRMLSAWRKGNFQISTHNLSCLRHWVLSRGFLTITHLSCRKRLRIALISILPAPPQPQPFQDPPAGLKELFCHFVMCRRWNFPPQLSIFITQVLWCQAHPQPFLPLVFRINMMGINGFSAFQLPILSPVERTCPWRSTQEGEQHPPEMLWGAEMGSKFVFCNTERIN